jgi:hypothetical protein
VRGHGGSCDSGFLQSENAPMTGEVAGILQRALVGRQALKSRRRSEPCAPPLATTNISPAAMSTAPSRKSMRTTPPQAARFGRLIPCPNVAFGTFSTSNYLHSEGTWL